MRSESEIKNLIINKAVSDQRIRAVLLNGSRVNSNVLADPFQDFDIVYVVTDLHSFICDHSWTNFFGEKIIEQLPSAMDLYKEAAEIQPESFSYLMLFTDGNRIDLTLYPFQNMATYRPESLTIVLLDKDGIFGKLPPASDKDYHIKPPTQKEFTEVCNEFWWVSTYVAKGLARNEIFYAKECLESIVRPMFMKMMAWYAGIQTNFSVSDGKGGKFLNKYLSEQLYNKMLCTYAGDDLEDNWKSLFVMTEIFGDIAKEVVFNLCLDYNLSEETNVNGYLRNVYSSTHSAGSL